MGFECSIGHVRGLRHHPAVINKVASATFMPKGGNDDTVRGHYWNVIHHFMYRHKINIPRLMLKQMNELTLSFENRLYFAPYIMSLILVKTKFQGDYNLEHKLHRPFSTHINTFFARPLNIFLDLEDEYYAQLAREQEAQAARYYNLGDDNDGNENVQEENMPPPQPKFPHPDMHGRVPPQNFFDPLITAL